MSEAPEDRAEAAAVKAAAAGVGERLGGRQPRVAIVLGSGVGHLVDQAQDAVRIPYAAIPGFPLPTIVGHGGELVIGTLAGRTVLLQSGRFHMYEGHDADVSARPVRVFAQLGIDTLLLTNAAGGINRSFKAGTLMLITDHLNLTGRNPLVGTALRGEERFPDLSEPYDRGLQQLARDVAQKRGIALAEGVYASLLGPSYETPAEVRMLGRLGADAVGMSTVIEVIAARARNVRCLGISTVTNPAAGITADKLSHADVLEVAKRVKDDVASLLEGIVAGLPTTLPAPAPGG